MRVHSEARRAAEWQILHDRITETLDAFRARKDAFGKGDYWLVDEDLGLYRQKLEVQNLNLLQLHIVKSLQALLNGFPDWQIVFQVAVPGKEDVWPGMGLIIRDNEIVDDLQREFLPEEFRHVTYPGSTPAQRPPASFP